MIYQLKKDDFNTFRDLVRKIGGVQAVLYTVPGAGQDTRFAAILGIGSTVIFGNATSGTLTAGDILAAFPDAQVCEVLDVRATSTDSVSLLKV